jgi:uncharacterized membrane protein
MFNQANHFTSEIDLNKFVLKTKVFFAAALLLMASFLMAILLLIVTILLVPFIIVTLWKNHLTKKEKSIHTMSTGVTIDAEYTVIDEER